MKESKDQAIKRLRDLLAATLTVQTRQRHEIERLQATIRRLRREVAA